MKPATKARLIAAAAFPLLLLNLTQAHAAPDPVPASAVAAARMDHISIVTRGTGSPVILIPGSPPRAPSIMISSPTCRASTASSLVQVNGFGGDAPGANTRPGRTRGGRRRSPPIYRA